MHLREATTADWPAIWPFFHRIVAAGDTYTYRPDLDFEEGRELWMPPAPHHTAVAVDDSGTVVGTARMGPNQGGNGAHVANASYMVDPDHGGRGTGRALCGYSLTWARAAGYRAMQFNAVVESNVHAVRLYQDLGFRILGTVPEGFAHPTEGFVGLHVMYRPL